MDHNKILETISIESRFVWITIKSSWELSAKKADLYGPYENLLWNCQYRVDLYGSQ